jgi:hypothetical protein
LYITKITRIKVVGFSFRLSLDQLDEDRRFLSGTIQAGMEYFDAAQIRDFGLVYDSAFKRARKLADRNLRRMLAKKARSHTLCWNVIKKLRRESGG